MAVWQTPPANPRETTVSYGLMSGAGCVRVCWTDLRKPTTMRSQQKDPILWSSAPNILWSIGEIHHLPIWPGCILALARFSYSPKIQSFELPSFRTCLEASTRKTRTWMRGHRTKKQERLVWIHLSFPLFGCTWHGVSSRFYDLRNSHICSYPTVCPFWSILYIESSEDNQGSSSTNLSLLTSSIHTTVLCPRSEDHTRQVFEKGTTILHEYNLLLCEYPFNVIRTRKHVYP